MAMKYDSRRIVVDTYSHQFMCECGWVSITADNGSGTAGAALVRHMLEHVKEEQ
jgi:hypothetical protein